MSKLRNTLVAFCILSSSAFAGTSFEVARWGKNVELEAEDTVVIWEYVNKGNHLSNVIVRNKYSLVTRWEVINGWMIKSWNVAEGGFSISTEADPKTPKELPDEFFLVAPKSCIVEPPSIIVADGEEGQFEVWCEGAMS